MEDLENVRARNEDIRISGEAFDHPRKTHGGLTERKKGDRDREYSLDTGESEVKSGADIVKLQRHLHHLEKVFNCFVPSGYQVSYPLIVPHIPLAFDRASRHGHTQTGRHCV